MANKIKYAVLWDRKSPIHWHWPDKEDWTLEKIISDPDIYIPLDKDVILITDGNGGTFEWTLLDNWRGIYKVYVDEISDPQEALEKCLEIRERPVIGQEDIIEMVDDLGMATVENTIGLDDMQDQIDLIGDAMEELIALQLS